MTIDGEAVELASIEPYDGTPPLAELTDQGRPRRAEPPSSRAERSR